MPQHVYTGLGSQIYVRALCDITEMKYLYCLDNGIVCAYHFSPHLRAAVRRCCVPMYCYGDPHPIVAVVFICPLFVFTYPRA